MAPEVLSSGKYGRKGDIWAVGCTMIQMLTGEPPWKVVVMFMADVVLKMFNVDNVNLGPKFKEPNSASHSFVGLEQRPSTL
jgi:serine/threonine protein kinase